MIFDDIFLQIKNSNSVAIFTHVRADGDCLGSGLAMYYSIKKLGKTVDLYNAEVIPKNFNFLIKDIVKHTISEKYDLYISVDSPNPKLLGSFGYLFEDGDNNTINIDHHISNTKYAKINYVDSKASSACEVVYDLLTQTKQKLDDNIAEAILCGIATDTGCFKYSSTTGKTHQIASVLYDFNIDFNKMFYYLFRIQTKKQILLTQKILNKVRYFCNDKVVISGLNKKDILDVQATENDMPRMVDSLVGIEGVQVAITYKQDTDGGFKVSFRSRGLVDVNELAQCFGGGGHVMASGCKIYQKEEQVVKLLVSKAGKFLVE